MIRDTGRTAMGAGVLARVDDDIIAEGGTRLEFESIAEAPMEYATLNDSRVPVEFEKSWTSRIGPFLTGAALGTAAHATYALVEQGNAIAIFSSDGLLGNLGAWVLSRSNPGVAGWGSKVPSTGRKPGICSRAGSPTLRPTKP